MKTHFRLLLLLLVLQNFMADAQSVPRYYHSILLDSVGLQFPGGGQLARPIPNPFRPIRIPATGPTLKYPKGAVNDVNGQLLYAASFNTQYGYPQLINRSGDSLNGGYIYDFGLSVPWPGRPRYHLLIGTAPYSTTSTNYPLTYGILDRQGNGGSGRVSFDSAYFPLRDTLIAGSQPLLARHRSGHGFWVLNIRPSGDLIAHRIDSSGVRLPAVVSRVGAFSLGGINRNMRLRLSLNQRRAVFTTGALSGGTTADSVDVVGLNFDDSTGQFTDPRLIYRYGFAQRFDSLYGPITLLALSPQGRYGYCYQYITDTSTTLNRLNLYQYDLWAGTQAAVRASVRRVASRGSGGLPWHHVFVGPDARVYLPITSGSVDVIDCPDQPAPSCAFRPAAVVFPRRRYTTSGTPIDAFVTFSTPYADVLPTVRVGGATARDEACVGETVTFALTQASGLDSARWHFGDGTSAPGLAVGHAYALPGRYPVVGVYYYRCAQDTVRRTLTVAAPPAPLLLPPADTACDQLAALRVRAPADVTWQWADGAAPDSVRRLTAPGLYALTWQRGGCRGREEVRVLAPRPCPALTLPNILTPATADGRNDRFVVAAPGPWRLTIYSRWGRVVWQSAATGYADEWDAHGLPAGTYYYHLEAMPANPAPATTYRGWVEVVR